MNKFIEECYHQHDTVCNQTYAKEYPYSFHLKLVVSQAEFFYKGHFPFSKHSALCAAAGHDLIEDARLTYNDILELYKKHYNDSSKQMTELIHKDAVLITEAIFACTESTGRNRNERKDIAYYDRLSKSELGTYIKLCDILANVSWSKLSKSNMYTKYRNEFPSFLDKITTEWQIRYAEIISAIKYQLEI